ncbi:Predicted arabinose efflux permease, MFS family [Arsukibacterium tuosuense]|uniref:Predicted arabinose efflux permease, MFS family n=1 Tax=Arsukibacterium tuosuense TaxID=1323745 RepID=A0A285IMX2_9GAMM|nr:MFS transporter [Arsukibacterium tuosuense]SNY49294.1 Predicted arabinose efflux permease, MFS family [Arsukibacterium tuosuense]
MFFRQALLPISSLFISIAFLATGYGMLMTYIGLYLKQAGLSEMAIGVINSAFFLGALLAAVFSQKLIVSVGHARSFSAFSALMVMAFLGHTLHYNPWFWAGLRLLSGFAFYALLIVLESWLNEKSSSDDRGRVLAVYTVVFFMATAIGQLILSMDITSHVVFVMGSVLVLASLFLVAITRISQPVLAPFERYSLPKVLHIAPLALVGSVIGGFFVGGFYTMVPVFVLNTYGQQSVVASFMAISILGGLLAQWPVGTLSDRYGRRKLLAWAGLFSFVICLLLALLASQTWLFYLLGFLLGTSLFSIYPLSVARANDRLDHGKDLVEVSRSLLFAYGIGSFLAPLILGAVLGVSGGLFFTVLALAALLLGGYALTAERIANEQLSVYVAVPAASGASLAQLDPRQDEQWVEDHKPAYPEDTDPSADSEPAATERAETQPSEADATTSARHIDD